MSKGRQGRRVDPGRRKMKGRLTPRQVERLHRNAMAWKAQGSRSKWSTKESLALWDAVDDIERNHNDPEYFGTADIKPKLSPSKLQNIIWAGMEGKNRVWIHYVDRNNNLTERLVKPISTSNYGVSAYCFTREAGRYFAYSSIVDARLIEKGTDEPTNT